MQLPQPEPFVPWRWARGAHAQTILGHVLREPRSVLPWTYETLPLEDGDALVLHSLPGTSGRTVAFFHGLGGNAGSTYLVRAAAQAWRRGHAVIAADHRGAGIGRGLAKRPYHSGASADVAAVLAHARKRHPGHHLTAVGFSLSAAMLLLLVARDRHLAQPDAALAVNPPGDLEACSQRLLRGLNRLYDRRFVGLLRAEVEARSGALPPTPTLRDFDEVYTARAAGFRDRADYYARCSCGPHLRAIQAPTVLLSSLDDPFAPATDLGPVSPAVHLQVERHGGHMGYLADRPTPLGSRRWLDYAVDHYLARLG